MEECPFPSILIQELAIREAALNLYYDILTMNTLKIPEGYLNRIFPQMKGMDGVLDDGLIRKVQRSVNGKVLCFEPAICSHVGFRYYDRVADYKNPGNDIVERIAWLREFLSDIPKRKQTDPKYLADLEEL